MGEIVKSEIKSWSWLVTRVVGVMQPGLKTQRNTVLVRSWF